MNGLASLDHHVFREDLRQSDIGAGAEGRGENEKCERNRS
jgi:hypothetical protein